MQISFCTLCTCSCALAECAGLGPGHGSPGYIVISLGLKLFICELQMIEKCTERREKTGLLHVTGLLHQLPDLLGMFGF